MGPGCARVLWSVQVGEHGAVLHGQGAVTPGFCSPLSTTLLLDFPGHIFGYKQLLWAARSEVGSHLLCKCYP